MFAEITVRFAAAIEYDGSHYCGWQRQAKGLSVQACVGEALSQVANHPISVVCAGRTDAGVHALQQVIHFDTHASRTDRAWVLGTNRHLPRSIRLHWIQPVAESFHARFCAVARTYRYVIYCSDVPSALLYNRVTWTHALLDVAKMQEAADFLVGTHDFSAFRANACQAKHPVKTVHFLKISSEGPFITLDIEANGFLHHMVRNIAGVLMAIGRGFNPPSWAQEVLIGRDRKKAGVTAPAAGLYFVGVRYGAEFGLGEYHLAGSCLWSRIRP